MKMGSYRFRSVFIGILLILGLLPGGGRAPVLAQEAGAGSWTRLTDPAAAGGNIYQLVAAPSNPDVLYAQQSTLIDPYEMRLYRSQDGGQTWQRVSASVTDHYLSPLAVDPEDPDILYATYNNQLFRSPDAGLTWEPLYPFGRVVVAPAPGRIYLLGQSQSEACSFYSEFARSLDGGSTWERVAFDCYHTVEHIFVDPQDPDHVIVSDFQTGMNAQTSQDGGLSWQPLVADGANPWVNSLAFDPQDAHRFYLSGMNRILRTDDGGENWAECGTIPENSPLRLLASGDRVYAIPTYPSITDKTLLMYQSEDRCATWWKSLQSLPDSISSLIGDPRTPGRLLISTNGYGVFVSATGGASWQESNTGITSPAVVSSLAISPSDPDVILAGSASPRPGVYRSEDGGLTWSHSLLDVVPLSMLFHPFDPQKAWAGTQEGLYFTENGSDWYGINKSFFPIRDLAISPADPDTVYGATSDGDKGFLLVYKTGVPFIYMDPLRVGDATDIQTVAVNPRDSRDLLAGGTRKSTLGYSEPALYRSQDGGYNWHLIPSSFFPMVDIVIDTAHPQIRYILTYKDGIMRSTDGGETWVNWVDGISILALSPTSGLAVDIFGGVYAFTQDSIYYRAGPDADWQTIQWPYANLAGALGDGDTPYLLRSGYDALWKLDLPPIHKMWFPTIGN